MTSGQARPMQFFCWLGMLGLSACAWRMGLAGVPGPRHSIERPARTETQSQQPMRDGALRARVSRFHYDTRSQLLSLNVEFVINKGDESVFLVASDFAFVIQNDRGGPYHRHVRIDQVGNELQLDLSFFSVHEADGEDFPVHDLELPSGDFRYLTYVFQFPLLLDFRLPGGERRIWAPRGITNVRMRFGYGHERLDDFCKRTKVGESVEEQVLAHWQTTIVTDPVKIVFPEYPADSEELRDSLQKLDAPALIKALADGDPAKRATAARILAERRSEAQVAIPTLRRALTAEESEVRVAAARALWELQKPAQGLAPILIKALRDTNSDVRSEAAFVLSRMGPGVKDAVQPLSEALKDEDVRVRRWAANGLARIGRHAVDALPVLVEALKDRDAEVRQNAAWALGEAGDQAVTAVPALIEVLHDRDWYVRWSAAEALGKMGRAAREAIPQLMATSSKDKEFQVRQQAAKALERIQAQGH